MLASEYSRARVNCGGVNFLSVPVRVPLPALRSAAGGGSRLRDGRHEAKRAPQPSDGAAAALRGHHGGGLGAET